MRIEDDLQLFDPGGPEYLGRGNAGDRLEARHDRLFEKTAIFGDRIVVAFLGLDEKPDQRFRVAGKAAHKHDRRIRIGRQGRQAIEAADHLEHRLVHIAPEGKGQTDETVAGAGIGHHLLNPGDALEDIFQGFVDLRFDLARCGRPPGRLYRDLRPVDVGKQLHRQPEKRHQA